VAIVLGMVSNKAIVTKPGGSIRIKKRDAVFLLTGFSGREIFCTGSRRFFSLIRFSRIPLDLTQPICGFSGDGNCSRHFRISRRIGRFWKFL